MLDCNRKRQDFSAEDTVQEAEEGREKLSVLKNADMCQDILYPCIISFLSPFFLRKA